MNSFKFQGHESGLICLLGSETGKWARSLFLHFWKPDGPKCNCPHGWRDGATLTDWLRDLVAHWTNWSRSQGHRQGPRQTNIPVSPLPRPCTSALTNTSKTKEPPPAISHRPHCVVSASGLARPLRAAAHYTESSRLKWIISCNQL